jgi:predicted dehydrogenase
MSGRLPKRVLICGLGSIGRRYCRLIRKAWPSVQLAALRSGHGMKGLEENTLNKCFGNIDEALAWNPQAVIVASPASLHLEQSLCFARLNVPLLIEKPLGTGLEDSALRNQFLAYARSAPIYVGYVLRHDPCGSLMREELTSRKFGSLISADFFCGSWLPDWRPDQDYLRSVSSQRDLGGGALLELSHEIDLAQWLLGPLTPLSALMRNSSSLGIDAEDQAFLLTQNRNGCPVSIRLDFCTQPARRMVTLRFENGELQWNLLEGLVSKFIQNQPVSMYQLGATPDERFYRQLELFWQCPEPHQSTLCSVREGFDVLELVIRARSLADELRRDT